MKKQYEYNDIITFKIGTEEITYKVTNSYLSACAHDNDYIFDKLNITDKEEFCKAAYGYKPENLCIFPECKYNDYDALNRVIEALQKECDEYSKEHFILYTNGDIIIFKLNGKILTYIVEKDHFRNSVGPNSQIFKELGMNIEEAKKFCSEIYGYTPTGCSCGSNFPEYHYKDYVAANKIIKALQKKCEEANALSESDGSDYDIDKVKQIKSIDADEIEIILTVNKNRKTF